MLVEGVLAPGYHNVRGTSLNNGSLAITGGTQPQAMFDSAQITPGDYVVSFNLDSISSGSVRFLDAGGGGTPPINSVGSHSITFTALGTGNQLALRCQSATIASISNLSLSPA